MQMINFTCGQCSMPHTGNKAPNVCPYCRAPWASGSGEIQTDEFVKAAAMQIMNNMQHVGGTVARVVDDYAKMINMPDHVWPFSTAVITGIVMTVLDHFATSSRDYDTLRNDVIKSINFTIDDAIATDRWSKLHRDKDRKQ